ncbi:TetR/AcrR family transcriptional regulator [Moorena sp. SIO3H5]|uniref:TetR/AcrR family transcriptional regulator n=1 Tax=Moorena sp. SIO3H5 TaxID=2607834 RepID=UPI0013B98645|nr:TetR/AcrR family transcriptional regulator [Moorena sp. SIO3H5]NEO71593.1 TetR/AcrR family transcriptional regulator [Moorena sp. SIO3H5]
MSSAKEAILSATETLLWDKGYSATSPKMIMRESGVGQGSLYHHFEGKPDLAAQTLAIVLERKLHRLRDSIFATDTEPQDQIHTYLNRPQKKINGCQMGRMAYDAEAMQIDELRGSLIEYFDTLHELLFSCLKSLEHFKSKSDEENHNTAWAIIANVQGAFLLARAYQKPEFYHNAITGLWDLLFGRKEA